MQQHNASDRKEYWKNHSIVILVKVIITLIASVGCFVLLQFVTPFGGWRRFVCLFVLLSTLVFIKKRKSSVFLSSVKIIKNKLLIIVFIIILSFIMVFSAYFIYQSNKTVHVVNRQATGSITLNPGDMLVQPIQGVPLDTYTGFRIRGLVSSLSGPGEITISISDHENTRISTPVHFTTDEIPKTGQWDVNTELTTIPSSKNINIIITLEASLEGELSLNASKLPITENTTAKINGESIGTLAIDSLHSISKNYQRTIIFTGIIFLAICFIFKDRVEVAISQIPARTLFLTFSIPIGLLYIFLIPPLHLFDEPEHYVRSVSLAAGRIIKSRIPDVVSENMARVFRSAFETPMNRTIILEMLREPSITIPIVAPTHASGASYSAIGYLPGAVAIWIAWLLQLSPMASIYLVRLLFFGTCIVIIASSFKSSGLFSEPLFVFSSLPIMMMILVTSGNDGVFVVACYVYVFLIGRLAMHDDAIDSHTVTLLFICSCIILSTKFVYFPILAIIFLLPRDRRKYVFKYYKNTKIIYSIIAVLFAISMGTLLVNLLFSSADARAPGANEINAVEQLLLIIKHPMSFIRVILITLFDYTIPHLYTQIASINGMAITGIQYAAYFTPILLIASMRRGMVVGITTKKIQWILIIAILAILIVAIIVPLYLTFTPVGAEIAAGVQGRYLLPLIPVIMILSLFRSNRNMSIKKISNNEICSTNKMVGAGFFWGELLLNIYVILNIAKTL